MSNRKGPSITDHSIDSLNDNIEKWMDDYYNVDNINKLMEDCPMLQNWTNNETPEEKAKRIGVPLIPTKDITEQPYDPNPVVAVCGSCGLEIHQVMGYVCTKHGCPTGLGSPYC